jgi:hypothetical protein
MKSNSKKILAITTIMIFLGAGVSMADGWKNEGGQRGHAYGHYKQREYPHYQYCAPRPVYVERHVYRPPAVYQAPARSGYFFGMSVIEPGMVFGFGVSGH